MKTPPELPLELESCGGECVLTILVESLMHNEAPGMASNVLDAVRQECPDAKRVVIDFDRVVHMNSNAVSVLLIIRNRLEQDGCELVLRNVSPEIRELFRFLCLDRLLPVIDVDVEESS